MYLQILGKLQVGKLEKKLSAVDSVVVITRCPDPKRTLNIILSLRVLGQTVTRISQHPQRCLAARARTLASGLVVFGF